MANPELSAESVALTDAQIAALKAEGWTIEKPTQKIAIHGTRSAVERFCRENGVAIGLCGDAWWDNVDVHTFFLDERDSLPIPKPERYIRIIDADATYRPKRIAELKAQLAALEAEHSDGTGSGS